MERVTVKDEHKAHFRKQAAKKSSQPKADTAQLPIVALQNQIGNAAIQRLLAQRTGNSPTELDDNTAQRINSARGGGQSLDSAVQTKMGQTLGQDFSGVRVHTSNDSHTLNEQLNAKAFTTGQDIFFRAGAYSPQSSNGQELIAHELTHVVQQGSGAVQSSGKMAVNAPGDRFEQEADAVAKTVTGSTAAGIQRQTIEEEEVQTKPLQRQEMEEEEVQTKLLQRQAEEEEALQMQAEDEEQVQMQELPEEEELPA